MTTEDPERPAVPPIGTVNPIRDVPDELVFRFELGPAILAQLLETLRRSPPLPIVEALKEAKYPGFYQIFLDGDPKYIGRTTRTIRARLREHVGKIRGRIPLDRIAAKFAFVEDPSLVDVSENALIQFFAEHGLADWNTSGFGSKVPGYRRGRQVASEWAEQFPADHAWPVEAGDEDPMSLYDLIRQVGRGAPITFSLPMSFRSAFRRDHAGDLSIPTSQRTFEEWVLMIEERLAPGWHIEKQASGWYVVRE